jgi:hypothetical protein
MMDGDNNAGVPRVRIMMMSSSILPQAGHPCWMRRNSRRMQNEDELYDEKQQEGEEQE